MDRLTSVNQSPFVAVVCWVRKKDRQDEAVPPLGGVEVHDLGILMIPVPSQPYSRALVTAQRPQVWHECRYYSSPTIIIPRKYE